MSRPRRLYGTHFREVHGFHESVHSTDTDVNAIATLKTDLNFMFTQSFIRSSIDFQNMRTNLSVFYFSARGMMVQKFVICTCTMVNFQNTADSRNGMLMR